MYSDINVLLVEDEQRDADLILRQIEKAGYKVQHAVVDTPEAFQKALQNQKWDIIISDYNIPGFGGPQALEIVKSNNTNIPFVLISGNVGEDLAVKTIKDGASDYLMKDNLLRLGNVIKNELAAAGSRKERQLLDQALNQISTAIAGSSVENFLSTVLVQLSVALQADYSFVGLLDNEKPSDQLQAVCVCNDGKITPNFSYSAKGTPCEDVLQNKVVLLPKNILSLYPDNKSFRDKQLEGYIGVPLNNAAGKIIGIMVLMYKSPVKAGAVKTSILRLYSSRIASEIERSKFHQALKASEKRFAAIFKNSPVGISLTSVAEGIFLDVNDMFLEKTGYTRADIIGKNSLELNLYKHVEDRNYIRNTMLSQGVVVNRECEFTGKHGNAFFCLISVSIVTINDTRYTLSSIIDINDRKIAIDKLLESEVKVSAYFNSTTEATVMVDGDGKILVFNKVYEDYISSTCKSKVVAGDYLTKYLQPQHQLVYLSNIDTAMAGGNPNVELELPYFNQDKKWMSVSFVAVKNQNKIIGVAVNHTDIHHRKKAEEKLKQSEYNLKKAQQLAKMGSWEYNFSTGEISWSDEMYAVFNVSKTETSLYETYLQRLHPDDLQETKNIFDKDDDYAVEQRAVMPDGSIKHIYSVGEFVKNEIGNRILRATAQDITERKKAEHKLSESENQLAAYFNSTSDIIILIAADLSIMAFNRMFENMVRNDFNVQAAAGDNVLNYLMGDLTEGFLNNFGKAIAGESVTVEREVFYPNRTSWCRVSYNPVRNKAGAIIGVAFNATDISKLKQGEKILRDSEIKFRSMVHNISDIITLVDVGGTILYQSASIRHVLGYGEDEIIGRNIFEFTHPDEMPFLLKQLKDTAVRGSGGLLLDFRFLNKKGEYVLLEAHANNQLNNPAINAIIINSRDITQRKNAEAALMKQAHELAVSNIELERFAYVASHDLQEPLRMVSSFMSLLKKKYHDQLDDTGNKYINYAVEGSLRMKQLINDLLLYSRVGNREHNYEPVNLQEVIENIKAAMQTAVAATGTTIITHTLPVVAAIKMEMNQLLQNLIDNAIKYQPEGNKPVIYVEGEDRGSHWLISVKDNGIGINPVFRDKIFVVFQRLHNKDAFSGTGIGLPVCKKIVDRAGGKIWVESELGKGCTFFFTIPKTTM